MSRRSWHDRPVTLTDLRTPAVLVDKARALRNIDRMQAAATARGLRLRPHAKTHKSPVIARWQIERGAVGICCAKIGEAEVFADAGVTDIRIPYPINPANADRVIALARRTHLSFIVDHRARGGAVVRGTGKGRDRGGRAGEGGRGLPPLRHRTGGGDRRAVHRHGGRAAGTSPEGIAVARRTGVSRLIRRAPPRDGRGRGGDAANVGGGRARGRSDDRGIERRRHANRAILDAAGRPHRVPARQLRLLRSHADRPRRRGGGRLRAHGDGAGGQQAGRRPRDPRLREQDAEQRRRSRVLAGTGLRRGAGARGSADRALVRGARHRERRLAARRCSSRATWCACCRITRAWCRIWWIRRGCWKATR